MTGLDLMAAGEDLSIELGHEFFYARQEHRALLEV
jgi:hypothetical protein